jgi:hypothetical protein
MYIAEEIDNYSSLYYPLNKPMIKEMDLPQKTNLN